LLKGKAGTKAALEKALASDKGRPRYLHFATHGSFQPEPKVERKADGPGWDKREAFFARNPMLLSRLVLAGANQDREAGILTAEEVVELDMRGVELTVMSADESARGMIARSEGVLGLTHAFHAAGARNVIANLWRIDDEAAKVLMVHFYEQLLGKKLPAIEALRQAQRFVLKNPGKVRGGAKVSPPLWWAGWVLSGSL
jgi:CHAT domain-containing protein